MFETVLADLRARGCDVRRRDDAGDPPAIVTGPVPVDGDDPVAVEPVESDPTALVERAAHAARHDRGVCYVVTHADAPAVREVLAAPRFIPESRDGLRRFYHVPDRIRLPAGGYAAVRATPPTPRYGETAREGIDRVLAWREEPGPEGDAPQLVLEVNRQPVTTLASVDALTCPGPNDQFPYRYSRRDGSFRVFKNDREVGRFRGVAAMRSGGYQPVPVPLVPEHHLRWGTPAMALAVVDGENVTYESV